MDKPMGRKRIREAGELTTTKVKVDVLRHARMIANYRNVTLFDFIDEILRVAVDREYDKMIREMTRQRDSGKR